MVQISSDPTKVLFRVLNEDGATHVETLWAYPLGSDRYRLDNSPFYAYGVSWQDVVYAPYSEDEDFPTFIEVVEKSGNRTIRITFEVPVAAGNKSDQVLKQLVALGCSFEGANASYVSVNIPSSIELEIVSTFLVEQNVQWEYADPTYETLNSMKA